MLATVPTAADLVERARKADATLRAMERNVRLARYQGRNGRSTGEQMDALQARRDDAVTSLVAMGERRLAGALTAEFGLARRMSEARDAGQDRPELRGRLAAARRDLRAA